MMTDQVGIQAGEWTPPEHRRCGHLHLSGERCQRATRTGEKFCHAHKQFADADPMYPIRVPLLEDPDAIRFVVSQTVRALAMGTIPSANGRGMLSGCRMALGLLVHALAEEKFRAKGRGQDSEVRDRVRDQGAPEVTGDRLQVAECAPEVTGDRLQVAEGAPEASCAELSRVSNGSLRGPRNGADGADGDGELETRCAADPVRIVPRFPDLAAQWDQGVRGAADEVARNLRRREDENGEEWMERQRGAIEAGHPQARTAPARAAMAAARRQDLPFDPMCPPAWDHATMKDWPKEHMAAWLRALSPTVTQQDVREFVRGMWEVPRADEKAGWPGRGEGAPPKGDCLFRTMTAEEIAAWVKKEIPDMPMREAQEYAEERVRGMGALRSSA
jgi:hypothetical protein